VKLRWVCWNNQSVTYHTGYLGDSTDVGARVFVYNSSKIYTRGPLVLTVHNKPWLSKTYRPRTVEIAKAHAEKIWSSERHVARYMAGLLACVGIT
jgi:hypothetical protein